MLILWLLFTTCGWCASADVCNHDKCWWLRCPLNQSFYDQSAVAGLRCIIVKTPNKFKHPTWLCCCVNTWLIAHICLCDVMCVWMQSCWSTAALVDDEMDLGVKQEGIVFYGRDWWKKWEAEKEKESKKNRVRWREHACWPPVWTHYIFIGWYRTGTAEYR